MLAIVFAIFVRSMQMGIYVKLIENVVNAYFGYMQVHANGYWEEKTIDYSFEQDKDLANKIDSISGVEVVLPRLESFALCINGERSRGVMLIGADLEKEKEFFKLNEKLKKGEWLEANDVVYPSSGLAEYLNVTVGDTLVLMSQGYHASTAADQYRVGGVLHFNNPVINQKILVTPLANAQSFYGAEGMLNSMVVLCGDQQILSSLDRIIGLSISDKDLKGDVTSSLDSNKYEVKRWDEMMPDMVQIIIADNAGGIIMLAILYMVISFGIFGTIVMLTNERKYEFGVLIAIGMKRTKLVFVLLLEIIIMAFLGVMSGLAMVTPIVLYFQFNPIALTGQAAEGIEKYGFEPLIPTIFDPTVYLVHSLLIMFITILIGVYPIRYILKLKAVEAMKV
jgi:ABC-type lipoprotein release transport system permease subunit